MSKLFEKSHTILFIKPKNLAYIFNRKIKEGFMEYTKDIIFGVRYDEVSNTLKSVKPKRTSRLFKTIKRHKLIVATVLSAIVFICIDIIIIIYFYT